MPKYKVTVDASYVLKHYEVYVLSAPTRSAATYKAAKLFGMAGKQFKYFITLFHPLVERVPDNTLCCYKYYTNDNDMQELRLVEIDLIKED